MGYAAQLKSKMAKEGAQMKKHALERGKTQVCDRSYKLITNNFTDSQLQQTNMRIENTESQIFKTKSKHFIRSVGRDEMSQLA